MRKVLAATTGVLASAAIGFGAYKVEQSAHDKEAKAVLHCYDLGQQAVKPCVSEAKDLYGADDGLSIIELAGLIGVVGCGYLGYKAVKEEVGATGIIEDME